jgi:hypothetical protein
LQNLKCSCADFYGATPTREEVVLNYGVSSNWERTFHGMEMELPHGIVLSPRAAKQLSGFLGKLIGEYESRYGDLK